MARTKIATIDMTDEAAPVEVDELIDRLDDGNNFPGFELEREGVNQYSLYSVK